MPSTAPWPVYTLSNAESLRAARACALIGETAQKAVEGAAGASPPPVGSATLEVSVRTADIAEAASWVRGVERTGPRELRFTGDDPLAADEPRIILDPLRDQLRVLDKIGR